MGHRGPTSAQDQETTPVARRRTTWRALRSGWSIFPPDSTRDARLLVAARAVRAFGDGFVSVLLPAYLLAMGFEAVQVGAISTSTLLGSAALTLLVGLVAHRLRRRSLLLAAALLMAATGLAFALVHAFWPLVLVAFIGTLNPSSGDVSVFCHSSRRRCPKRSRRGRAPPCLPATAWSARWSAPSVRCALVCRRPSPLACPLMRRSRSSPCSCCTGCSA